MKTPHRSVFLRFLTWRVAVLAISVALLAFLRPSRPVQAQAQERLGRVIRPTMTMLPVAQLRTPQDMHEFERDHGADQEFEVPILPTEDPAEYEAAKAAANAKADATPLGRLGIAGAEVGPFAPPALRGINFDGITRSGAGGSFPPDTHGAAGLSHYMQVTNRHIDVYVKSAAHPRTLSRTLSAFFGSTQSLFDPRVVFDLRWQRWVLVTTRRSASSTDPDRHFFLAVSQTSNPNGAYYVYKIPFAGAGGDWWDYPQLGMDQDAILVTGNVFTFSDVGRYTAMMSLAKAQLYNNVRQAVPTFTGLVGTLAPPIVLDDNKDAYFVAGADLSNLHLYRGENLSNGAEATLTLQALVNVPDWTFPPDAAQPGTSLKINVLGRFVNASTQVGDSLWNVHTIDVGARPTPRFYEIDTEGAGANTVKQLGTFFRGGLSYDWNPSIAVNTRGEAFVTWSATDPTTGVFPEVRFSGRQPADPLGSIPAGSRLFVSPRAYTETSRWGDYSAVTLDPVASGTCEATRRAWIVNEKVQPNGEWGTRIARIGPC